MKQNVADIDLAVVERAAILTRGHFGEVFLIPGSDVGPREAPNFNYAFCHLRSLED